MLTHPTLDLLHSLGLHGMAKGFKDLDAQSEARSLEHAEWLALLLEHEKTLRQQKRFESRARTAKLRHTACVEDVDYRAIRGLDRALFLKLAAGDWIRARHNLLVTGPCGVGKSWLACALGNKACRDDFAVAYHRVPRLFTASHSATPMAVTPRCCALSLISICSFLMTGGQSRSTPTSAVICLRLSRTDMKLARSLSPASCPSTAGTKSSATPPWPTQSSIASSTTPTALNSKERASGSKSNPLQINRSLDLLIPRRHHQIDPCD